MKEQDYESILSQTIAIVQRAAGPKSTISPDTSLLVDLDLDSLAFVELLEAIDEKFGSAVIQEVEDFRRLETPAMIAGLVAAASTRSTQK